MSGLGMWGVSAVVVEWLVVEVEWQGALALTGHQRRGAHWPLVLNHLRRPRITLHRYISMASGQFQRVA